VGVEAGKDENPCHLDIYSDYQGAGQARRNQGWWKASWFGPELFHDALAGTQS
jgi:hypothetical protein